MCYNSNRNCTIFVYFVYNFLYFCEQINNPLKSYLLILITTLICGFIFITFYYVGYLPLSAVFLYA